MNWFLRLGSWRNNWKQFVWSCLVKGAISLHKKNITRKLQIRFDKHLLAHTHISTPRSHLSGSRRRYLSYRRADLFNTFSVDHHHIFRVFHYLIYFARSRIYTIVFHNWFFERLSHSQVTQRKTVSSWNRFARKSKTEIQYGYFGILHLRQTLMFEYSI